MKLKELNINQCTDGILLTSRENKYYTAGLYSGSGYVLVCEDETFVIVDGRYYTEMKQNNSINTVCLMDSINTFDKIINEIMDQKKIYSLGIEDTVEVGTYLKIKTKLNADLKVTNLLSLRCIKKEEEIKNIKEACQIAVKTYEYILSFVKVGMSEIEVANEMVHYMKKNGAEKESFDTIVVSGKRGALPHGKPSNKLIEDGDFITIDFGGVYNHYCSDITRTFQIGNKDNDKIKEIFDVVLEAQKAAISAIRPGKRCCDIDLVARNVISEKGYGTYFTHNLGHSMGILCHEEPRFSPNEEMILKIGMVLTVEPGIYIENIGGVRIEDDVLVTEYGCEVLTKAANKEYTRVKG